MSAILSAVVSECSPIIAVDIHENRLKVAKEMGATHTINASKEDPVTAL